MSNNSEVMALQALLGDYPNTSKLRNGELRSPHFALNFAETKSASKLFPLVVRDLKFDVAELAIVTYLTAKAHNKPLVLLPVVVRGKLQHESLCCGAARPFAPADLVGRRVGIRSHSVTTVTWLRGILQNDYGVDLDRVKWITFEDAHVAEVSDPDGFERAPAGKKLTTMLLDGELDAGVVTGSDLKDPRFACVFPDMPATAEAWRQRYGLTPINHMVVVKDSLSRTKPEVVEEIFSLLAASKKEAGLPAATGPDPFPLGVESMRKSLQMIIKYAAQQRLIPRQFEVDDLFDDVTRALGR